MCAAVMMLQPVPDLPGGLLRLGEPVVSSTAAASAAPIRSRFRGLSWDKKHQGWRVRIYYSGKQRHVGRFECDIAAAKAYDKAAVYLYGINAITNFGLHACQADTTEVSPFIVLAKEQADQERQGVCSARALQFMQLLPTSMPQQAFVPAGLLDAAWQQQQQPEQQLAYPGVAAAAASSAYNFACQPQQQAVWVSAAPCSASSSSNSSIHSSASSYVLPAASQLAGVQLGQACQAQLSLAAVSSGMVAPGAGMGAMAQQQLRQQVYGLAPGSPAQQHSASGIAVSLPTGAPASSSMGSPVGPACQQGNALQHAISLLSLAQ